MFHCMLSSPLRTGSLTFYDRNSNLFPKFPDFSYFSEKIEETISPLTRDGVMNFDFPGIDPKEIKVHLKGGCVLEVSAGSKKYTQKLPRKVDPSSISSDYKWGRLTVKLSEGYISDNDVSDIPINIPES